MIRIANAPCSWGVLEFDLEGKAAGYEQVLNEIKETGYSGTELGDWGFMPTQPDQLHKEIQLRGLDLIGAFVPVNFVDKSAHDRGLATVLETGGLMKKAGYDGAFIVLADDNGKDELRVKNAGRINPNMSLSDQEWETYTEGVNLIAANVKKELGMRSVFHHHCAGYVETSWELDKLMELTDPAYVGLCLDTGHMQFAGGDPLEALKKYQDRIWHVHFKDCDDKIARQSREGEWNYFQSVQHGIFCKLGEGRVDFKGMVDELKRNNYEGWIVVEQDVLPGLGSPKECAQHNRDFIKNLGL